MPQNLVQLIYYSSIASNFQDIEKLLEVSRARNAENCVTGALWLCGPHFVQVLEGTRAAVSDTFVRIAADARHSNVHLVSVHDIDARMFENWWMSFLGDGPHGEDVILGAANQSTDLDSVSSDHLIAQMMTLRRYNMERESI